MLNYIETNISGGRTDKNFKGFHTKEEKRNFRKASEKALK